MKNLFKITLLGALIFFSINLHAQWGVKGKGEVVKKSLDIKAFHAVALAFSADVFIEQGSRQSVEVEGQTNIIDLIERDVKDGRWLLKYSKNVSMHKSVKVYITVPELSAVSISGSGSIVSEDKFKYDGEFSTKISGSGDIKMDIDAKSVEAKVSGSGDITLKGNTGALGVRISGSGDVYAYGLAAKDCSISIAGSGDCQVMADGYLKASISGSGDVHYKGDAKVEARVSGSGDVVPKS